MWTRLWKKGEGGFRQDSQTEITTEALRANEIPGKDVDKKTRSKDTALENTKGKKIKKKEQSEGKKARNQEIKRSFNYNKEGKKKDP